ncbi:four helix bundle protein [Patescibacteria group bacterium]|nr:four helix bundle protein [Patescibacteria group bacterium]
MVQIQSYRDLIVWQKSMRLVADVYKLTNQFPKSEIYGLVSQMRRASISIPSNIAEGNGRGIRKDYRHFLLNSFGSGAELSTQIEIAKMLGFGNKLDYDFVSSILEEVMKMLSTIIKKLKT